jgi:hippurate hydrolase
VQQAVVSVTQIHGGDAYNVIPQTAMIAGTCRSFAPEVRDLLERRVAAIGHGVGEALQLEVEVAYERGYPPTVNSEAEATLAADAAAEVVGEQRVDRATAPAMGAEDFSYLLEQRPGSYIFMGSGRPQAPLHSPQYDFNDEALTVGASYWARLVERLLPAG